MPDASVRVAGELTPRAIRVNGINPTFVINTDRIAEAAQRHPEDLDFDLLRIACVVFAADASIRRGGATRQRMGGDWRRQFRFDIPVSDPALWNRHEVKAALIEALHFLTDDHFEFEFRRGDAPQGLSEFLGLPDPTGVGGYDEVILFSGGLDSFAGALETLASTGKRIILVTHRSAQKTIPHQLRLGQWLKDRFPGRVLHLNVAARRVGPEAVETTQRSRSFLFAAIGQVVARAFNCSAMTFFENGIVSENLPFSPQVTGTMATRTTHPLALHLIGRLHRLTLPEAVPIGTPYAWLTKTEVVRRVDENAGASQIRDTVSCTHVRDQDSLVTHCAACSQCLDRRFAILAAGLEAHDPAEMYRHDILTGAREADTSRTIALDWSRHAVRMAEIAEDAFLREFMLELQRIADGFPELASRDVFRRSKDMHARHGRAVLGVLSEAMRSNAGALAAQNLPTNSLLVMHAGGSGVPAPAADRFPEIVRLERDRPQEDLGAPPLGTDAPLTVILREDNGRRFIDVAGLTSLAGSLVRVPWLLAVESLNDQMERRAPSDHRFILTGKIAIDAKVEKFSVNQMVRRCRKAVDDAFRQVHGIAPPRVLLIETRHNLGYRLEPSCEVVKSGAPAAR